MLPVLVAILMLPCAAIAARYFCEPARPAWPLRLLGLTVAFAVATLLAALQGFELEVDSCIDAGGVLRNSGHCELDPRSDPYVAQLARPAFTYPGVLVLSLALLINAFVPAWVAYQLLVRSLHRRGNS